MSLVEFANIIEEETTHRGGGSSTGHHVEESSPSGKSPSRAHDDHVHCRFYMAEAKQVSL